MVIGLMYILDFSFVCNEIKNASYFGLQGLFPRPKSDARGGEAESPRRAREQRNADGGLRWPRPRTGQAGPFSIACWRINGKRGGVVVGVSGCAWGEIIGKSRPGARCRHRALAV